MSRRNGFFGYAGKNDTLIGGLWSYFSPWATQWYFPAGIRGPLWNLLHGNGWRTA